MSVTRPGAGRGGPGGRKRGTGAETGEGAGTGVGRGQRGRGQGRSLRGDRQGRVRRRKGYSFLSAELSVSSTGEKEARGERCRVKAGDLVTGTAANAADPSAALRGGGTPGRRTLQRLCEGLFLLQFFLDGWFFCLEISEYLSSKK